MVVYLQPPFLPDIRYDRYGDTLESTPARGSTPSRRKKWLGETITDIARKFGVNSIGLVIDYSGGHAYNLMVFSDGTWAIFEPQSDSWPTIGSGLYKFENGYVLL